MKTVRNTIVCTQTTHLVIRYFCLHFVLGSSRQKYRQNRTRRAGPPKQRRPKKKLKTLRACLIATMLHLYVPANSPKPLKQQSYHMQTSQTNNLPTGMKVSRHNNYHKAQYKVLCIWLTYNFLYIYDGQNFSSSPSLSDSTLYRLCFCIKLTEIENDCSSNNKRNRKKNHG